MKKFRLLIGCIACAAAAQAQPPQVFTAYITNVSLARVGFSLSADYVQMLTGDDAIAAARKAGEAEFEINGRDTTWSIPNDYFILNENTKLRHLKLAGSADVFLCKDGAQKVKSTLVELGKNCKDRLFNIHIAGEKVIKIEEVYIP